MNIYSSASTVILNVGEKFHLKTGKDNIYYAGMPSDEVYSIVQLKSSGYQGYAWNLFFNKRQNDIIIDGVQIHVIRTTAQEIEIRVSD